MTGDRLGGGADRAREGIASRGDDERRGRGGLSGGRSSTHIQPEGVVGGRSDFAGDRGGRIVGGDVGATEADSALSTGVQSGSNNGNADGGAKDEFFHLWVRILTL